MCLACLVLHCYVVPKGKKEAKRAHEELEQGRKRAQGNNPDRLSRWQVEARFLRAERAMRMERGTLQQFDAYTYGEAYGRCASEGKVQVVKDVKSPKSKSKKKSRQRGDINIGGESEDEDFSDSPERERLPTPDRRARTARGDRGGGGYLDMETVGRERAMVLYGTSRALRAEDSRGGGLPRLPPLSPKNKNSNSS